jgi:phosphatidylserine/phosphatidylglycerophosphate/cardiolipin synthase-like enzyme
MPEVRGRVRNDVPVVQPGVRVELWYFHLALGLRRIDFTSTDTEGRFVLSISLLKDLLAPPVLRDVHVRIKSAGERLLWKSTFRHISLIDSDWDLGDVTVPRTTFAGWRITNLDPAGAHAMFSENNFVKALVDAEEAWSTSVKASVEGSTQEIDLLLFYLDIENLLLAFDPGHPVEGSPTLGTRLEELLLAANRRSPPVTVRFVPRRAFAPFPRDEEYEMYQSAGFKVRDYFARADNQPNTVNVKLYDCSVRLPMHAKMMVFDNHEAHLIGSPFHQQYYDSQAHVFDEPRRGKGGNIGVPIHDVGVSVRGPAVGHLKGTFTLHWRNAGGEDLPPVTPPAQTGPNASIQVARTLPGLRFDGIPDGETGIFEAYLRALEQAGQFIYLENQYFVDPTIMEAIRLALRRNTGLQIIILINSRVDMWPYNYFQKGRIPDLERARIPALMQILADEGTASRIGIFSLWGHEANTVPRQRLVRNYVHSKVAFADDKWATVGSANLDGVSLARSEHYVFEKPRSRDADVVRRATELNVLVFGELDNLPSSPFPAELRRKLWAEHLGVSPSTLVTPPSGGWLALWRERAEEKLARLKERPARASDSRILPWKPHKKPDEYLRSLGITPEDFDLRLRVRAFDFDTGQWIET